MKVGDIVCVQSSYLFSGGIGEIIQSVIGIELPYRVRLFGNPSFTTWFYPSELTLATDQQALKAKLK